MAYSSIAFINSSAKALQDSYKYVKTENNMYVYMNVYTQDEIRLTHKLPKLSETNGYTVYY